MIQGSGSYPYYGANLFPNAGSGIEGSMENEKMRAEMDQLQAAKDLNDAKKASYDKATIQARN
ncbi:hypothetical protein [Pseudomonas sp. MUP55]|uniref:hypothetical protein n=1 Tax=Pseudomonas sp. MUP55 TaxID=3087234 RepID=UPI002A59D3AB|nr:MULTISPECIES: hypothetical protein [unclassified Pseudomonas]WPN93501.1 hypothetical protein SC319_03745 [Pseudomonas sp. MUP56]WPN99027.1 hypothetical protein SC318_03745 [Pseudomonas sp. MUP55]